MKFILLPAVVLALVFSALGQNVSEEIGKNELTVWGGFAPAVRTFQPTGGRTWDAKLGIGALRYSHRWNTSRLVNIKYTMDAVPVLVLNYPDVERTLSGDVFKHETRYAFGGSPVGLQGNFRPKKKLQPFIAMSLGVLIFNETTPNDLGKKLNFSTEGGGGVEYRLSNKKALTFGYKFYHISNASRGEINPGFDSQMLYLGYTFYSK